MRLRNRQIIHDKREYHRHPRIIQSRFKLFKEDLDVSVMI